MEVQDHNLLVVSLDNCISSGSAIGKPGSCIYTAAMSNGGCNHETSIVELAPNVQCLSTSLPRLHQHLTQLQPIQYPQAVSYESVHQHSNIVTGHAIYQPMTATPLHHYSQSQAIISNTTYLNTVSTPSQTVHIAPGPPFSVPPAVNHTQPQIIQQPPAPESQSVVPITETNSQEFEVTSEPTFPEDDYEYYKEIYDFLKLEFFPQGVSDNYKRHLRKRAQHYLILDGKLYHNRKRPKEVIMKKEDQQSMLKEVHVIKDTGIHLGVKKMFCKIQTKHFWRGMYIDVVTFVKNCEKCSDVVDMERQKQLSGDFSDTGVDDPAVVMQSTVATQYSQYLKIWKKVEVCIHGPFRRTAGHQELLMTVVDEESRWVVATPISSMDNVVQIADFLFHTFCSYGFANCVLVGFTKEIKERLAEELKSKVKDINVGINLIDKSVSNCQWVTALVDSLVQTYPDWEQNLNKFLFQFRTGQLKTFCSPFRCTPFSAIFNRDPLMTLDCDDENKENIDEDCSVSSSKKLRSQPHVLQCGYCDESFATKISLRIHVRKHHKTDCQGNNMTKSKLRCSKKKRVLRKGVLKLHTSTLSAMLEKVPDESDFKPPESCVESTVTAVKAFLAATKEERRRRGKYRKYTPELQEHMASYAVKHGNQQAVRYFSEYLGTLVSESTIRNLVKVHSSFTPYFKEEIGRFAANFGVEPAARYFSSRLKRVVPHNLVRKFKLIYLEKLPDANKQQKDRKSKDFKKRCMKKTARLNTGNKVTRFSSKIKEEIGLYACDHSFAETTKYFSEKLQTTVSEWTVKRFHKAYVKRFQLQVEPQVDRNLPVQTSEQHSVDSLLPISVNIQQVQPANASYSAQFSQNLTASGSCSTATCLPAHPPISLYPMNHNPPENDCYNLPSSSSSVIVAQTSNPFQYQSINSVQNYQPSGTSYSSHETIPPVPQSQPDVSSYVVTQQPLIVSHETNNLNVPTHFMVASQPRNQEIEIQRPVLDKAMQKTLDAETESNIVFFVKCENAQPVLGDESYTSQPNPAEVTLGKNSDLFHLPQDQSTEQATSTAGKRETSEEDDDEDDDCAGIDDEEEQPLINRLNDVRNKIGKSKKSETSKKRGTYTMYSPELRAEIGKYAAEHSSLKACQYFGKVLGHEVPESTARGLKEKYLRKKVHCTVTSLGYSQRGRPLRLGKYDEVVQECLKELVRSGERVSSFLAITTAKQILNKCEPELLEDNGGPIKLNTTWAKSFLKRIGVHNNS